MHPRSSKLLIQRTVWPLLQSLPSVLPSQTRHAEESLPLSRSSSVYAGHATDATPGAFLNYARQYYQAAEEAANCKVLLIDVRYFLYFHATELLLKSYLRARGVKSRGHKISELYKDCRKAGLTINSKDEFAVRSVVSLLESGNKDMGFRYFTLKSKAIPDMNWTREVVGQLLSVVTAFVEPNGAPSIGAAVKVAFIIFPPSQK